MGDMLKSLKQFVEFAKGDDSRLNWFANQFTAIITRRLENEGNTLTSRLGVLHEAIDIFSNVRPTLPNNENVEKLTRLLFVDCSKIILSEGYRELDKTGTNIQLNNFKSVILKAVNRLIGTGYSHRFELLKYLLEHHWNQPILQQLMLGLPCDYETALAYIETGETTEMFHVRVQLLLQSGYHDLALNLCNWCVKSRKFWYDSYIRAVQLHLLQSKGALDLFTKQCQQLPCCKGLEIARQVKIDSELYLALLQTILIQDWLRPNKHCCTKELLGLWLEARYQVEETEQGFLNSVSGLVGPQCSTWQLMSLIDVMHSKFGKHFMQFYLEVCLKVLRKDKSYLEEARALRKQSVIESQRSSLTYICTIINCVSVNWSWKLRRLAMLTAMSLEPSEEYIDIIESLYETTEERHDCHLVENVDNVQVDVRGRPHRRKQLTKFELRAATTCSKDGYVFIPEASDLKQQGMNKTIRRRVLHEDDNEEPLNLTSDSSNSVQDAENHSVAIKEEPNNNPDCVCHINEKCPCGKAPIKNAAILNGHIADTSNPKDRTTADEAITGEESTEQGLLTKYFVVRDVLPKTSQDLIDVLLELCCPDLHPDQPFEDLYHKCESHLHPPPHCCIFEVFDGGLSPVGSDVDEDVEMFEIRPGATKWIFDGEDLDAPEPKIGRGRPRKTVIYEFAEYSNPSTDNDEIPDFSGGKSEVKRRRGRPRKKVIYEEIDDRTTDSDTDRADSQYSGSTVVNSPMSVSTETEEFEIQINEDTDSTQFLTDSHALEKRTVEQSVVSSSNPDQSDNSSQALKGIVSEMPHVKKKDVIKRETIVKNFDRICSKIKKGKFTTNASTESIGIPEVSVPSTSTNQSRTSKARLTEYMKDKHGHEARAKETVTRTDPKPSPNVGGHDYSRAQKHNYHKKHSVADNAQSENSRVKFPTWDASLRQVSGTSVDMLKDYRIPKKATEIQATTSKVQPNVFSPVQSRSVTQIVSPPGSLQHASHQAGGRPHMEAVSQSNSAQHMHGPSRLNVSKQSAVDVSVSMANTFQPQSLAQHTSTNQSVISAVKQLASRPAHKSLVSPVILDNTAKPPFFSFTEHSGSQQQVQAQTKTSSQTSRHAPHQPQQQQPFTYFTQAATYQQGQPQKVSTYEEFRTHHQGAQHTVGKKSPDGQGKMSTVAGSTQRSLNQQTHIGSTQVQPGLRHQGSFVESINQRLPSNATVHSEKTQSKVPGAIPASGKTTVVPLSPAQVKAARSSLDQEVSTQQTVYLASFVADPEKPWPCLSVPEVLSQLDASQAKAAQLSQDLTQRDFLPHDAAQSTGTSQMMRQKQTQHTNNQSQPTVSLPPSTNANSRQSYHGQRSDGKVFTKQQHIRRDMKETDSQIEMYSTHKSPVRVSKSYQSSEHEVVVVPQLKEVKDIEAQQISILSNLRKKMGLGDESSKPSEPGRPQVKENVQKSDKGMVAGKHFEDKKKDSAKKNDFGSLQSQIGLVIENVIRSDHFRQKDKKNNSSLSSQTQNEKKDFLTLVNQSSAQVVRPRTSIDSKDSNESDIRVTNATGKLGGKIESTNAKVVESRNDTNSISDGSTAKTKVASVELNSEKDVKDMGKNGKLANKSIGSKGEKEKSKKDDRSEEEIVEIETALCVAKTEHGTKEAETSGKSGDRTDVEGVVKVKKSERMDSSDDSESKYGVKKTLSGEELETLKTIDGPTTEKVQKVHRGVKRTETREVLETFKTIDGPTTEKVQEVHRGVKRVETREGLETLKTIDGATTEKLQEVHRGVKRVETREGLETLKTIDGATTEKLQEVHRGVKRVETREGLETLKTIDGAITEKLQEVHRDKNTTQTPKQMEGQKLSDTDNKKETGNDGEEGICGANKDSVVQTDDYTDSDDSCDPLPPDGSYKMMALSPKSSSVKVLEGTNVNDLLESLQDSSGTAPQEVVRAAHLKLNKDESIEDVLQKLEHTGSSSAAADGPFKATPGTKRSEKVAWGCAFKQGVYSVEVSKDRTRKQKFRTKKISKEELENEPISEMANKEGVKVFVIQVKKSSRPGSGRSTPAIGSPVSSSPEEDSVEPERPSTEPVKTPAADIDILAKPIKSEAVDSEEATQGKEPDKTELGVGAIECSLPTSTSTPALSTGDKKQTVSVPKSRVNGGNSHSENHQPKLMIKSNVNTSHKEQQSTVASRSPEQVVTVRPQYGRLIPELSPKSQRIKSTNVTVSPPTSGTVKAVFTVAGTAASPHLKSTEKIVTLNPSQTASKKEVTQVGNSSEAKTVVTTSSVVSTSSSTTTKPVFANVYGRGASTKKIPATTSTVINIPKATITSSSSSCEVKVAKAITSVTNSVTVPCTTTATVISHREQSPISASWCKLPAGAKVTKVVMHPSSTNYAKILDVPARVLNRDVSKLTNDCAQSTTGRGVLISHNVVEWDDVVAYFAKHNFLCKICSKTYATKNMMKLHVTGMHSQVLHMEDGYICPLCEGETKQKFPTFEEIKLHMEGKHRRALKQEVCKTESKVSTTPHQHTESPKTSPSAKTSGTPDTVERPESPTSEANPSTPAKVKLMDSSSDDEITFKEARVLSPEEWPPSPVENTQVYEDEEEEPVEEKRVVKRGRPRKQKVGRRDSTSSKRVTRRKTSRSPDLKHKFSEKAATKSSSKSKSSKENEENTPRTTRRHSRSPPRPGKRKASPSPTSSLSGRPARKNTLNQRLQQRRTSEEISVVPVKQTKRRRSLEKGKRANSKDSTDLGDSVTKAPPNKKAKTNQTQHQNHGNMEKQSHSSQKHKHSNVTKTVKSEDDLKVVDGNSCESSDDTIDLNESEHVSVIKINKSPETYQKLNKLTDWGKHAEEQQKEWEEVINNEMMEVKTDIDEEPLDSANKNSHPEVSKIVSDKNVDTRKDVDKRENAEVTVVQEIKHKVVVTQKDAANTQVLTEKDNEINSKTSSAPKSTEKTVECTETQVNSVRQTRKSPVRQKGNSPHRKPGSPKSSLWSGNVRPGSRDWSKVKTYERKRKAHEKMCSIKRNRSEDEEWSGETQKRPKNGEKKSEDQPQKSEADIKTMTTSDSSSENQNETKTKVSETKTLTPKTLSSSSPMPRTSPCAVSIQRLNIEDASYTVTNSETTVINTSKSSDTVKCQGNETLANSDNKTVVYGELAAMDGEKSQTAVGAKSNPTKTDSGDSPVTPQGKAKGSRVSNASNSNEFVLVESLHSDDEKKLTSPPRVTRSRERSVSRGSSVSTVSSGQTDSPVKGHRESPSKNKESSNSQSLLKSKPKPVVIGDEVIGQPLSGQKQSSANDALSQPRRSSRPSTSQYSVNQKPNDDVREEKRSTSGRKR